MPGNDKNSGSGYKDRKDGEDVTDERMDGEDDYDEDNYGDGDYKNHRDGRDG